MGQVIICVPHGGKGCWRDTHSVLWWVWWSFASAVSVYQSLVVLSSSQTNHIQSGLLAAVVQCQSLRAVQPLDTTATVDAGVLPSPYQYVMSDDLHAAWQQGLQSTHSLLR
jgi:hypothetical protein